MLTYPQFVECVRQSNPRFTNNWLNSQQDGAVRANPHPPTFIVAGPGTGKTTVLALRVLKLVLVDGMRPDAIIATTFTRKAAGELRSRILAWGYGAISYARTAFANHPQLHEWLMGLDINGVNVGTLDSLAEQFLHDCRPPGGITPSTIEAFLARGIMRRFGLFTNNFRSADFEALLGTFVPRFPGPRDFRGKLSVASHFADRVRHDLFDIDAFSALGPGHLVLRDIVRNYLQYIQGNHFADYARLERLLYEALQQNQLQGVTDDLQAILVDEFQDTNYLQELIYFEFCTRSSPSLTVVGDDDQSVFRFRGATVEIFANFQHRIVDALGQAWAPYRVDLVENYRSSAEIVGFVNRFVQLDPRYQSARVPGKQPLLPRAEHATIPHPPVLGMFRSDCDTLARDLAQFLHAIFRGTGVLVNCAAGESYTIERGVGGDFGDAVLLAASVREYGNSSGGQPPRQRLPLLLRQYLDTLHHVLVFNPRGRDLYEIRSVRLLLGLTLLCIDGDGAILQAIPNMASGARARLHAWRTEGSNYAQTNPAPGGLQGFVQNWQSRTPPGGAMPVWPSEWPLLDLIFTLITWIPEFQHDPEGQVYLEAIARTVAEAGQFGVFGSRILHGTNYDQPSVRQAIREIFESIAYGNVEVDEEIMPYVPRSTFPIMTVHQAKGLEFPLVVVDVGSDFRRNHPSQRRSRYPTNGDQVHLVEELIAPFCPIGPARTQRPALERAWDDLRRLYFVAYSRPENAIVLVGLTSQLGAAPRVQSVATGDTRSDGRALHFIPAAQWHSGLPPGHIALI